MRIFRGIEWRMRSFGWKAAVAAALTVGLTAGASAVASAAHAQSITACVNDKNGAVTIRSSLEKRSCPKNTTTVVLGSSSGATLTVQTLNIVDASNKVRASLGTTPDGNVLTFFDSGGNKTLTVGNNAAETAVGATAWDNNNIIPGTGVPRVGWGESNPNFALSNGFGDRVYDANGKTRTGFGMSYDLTSNSAYAIDANGTATGVGIFQATSFAGYFANDLNGVGRQFGGLSLDGTANNWGAEDPNGVVRVSARQVPPNFVIDDRKGNGFAISDQNGTQEASMGAFTDGSLAGFNVVDPNNIDRFSAYLTTLNGMNVDTRDQNGNVTGHLP